MVSMLMKRRTESDEEKFTLEQVAANPDLMTCDGWVVDVSKFRADHPGGVSFMNNWAGRDISEVFSSEVSHKHSEYAQRVLETLRVGVLFGADVSRKESKKYDGLLDVDKPFLFQIGNLGASYEGWMASQPVVRNLTIFPWSSLESITRYPWWWIWVAIPPLIAYGIHHGLSAGLSLTSAAAFFVLGVTTWVIIEYFLHRFLFHLPAGSYGSNIFHFFAHGLHHLTPHDHTRLTFPPPFTIVLAYVFWNFFKAMCLNHIGFSVCFAGFVTGYISYDTTHFLYHHTDVTGYGGVRFPTFFVRYLKFMKSHHNVHHYLNDTCNYGVSNPVLDFVFGTYMAKKEAELLRETKPKLY